MFAYKSYCMFLATGLWGAASVTAHPSIHTPAERAPALTWTCGSPLPQSNAKLDNVYYPDIGSDYYLNAMRVPTQGGCAVTVLMDSSGIVREATEGGGAYWLPVCGAARSSLHPDPAEGMLENTISEEAVEVLVPDVMEEGQGFYLKMFDDLPSDTTSEMVTPGSAYVYSPASKIGIPAEVGDVQVPNPYALPREHKLWYAHPSKGDEPVFCKS